MSKPAQSRRVVDLEAVRREGEMYAATAEAGERLLAARRALSGSGGSVDLPAAPEDVDALLAMWSKSDPVEEARR